MQEIEKLEDLPRRERIKKSDWDRDYYNSDYPWNRVGRFLFSRVGLLWDDVVSEYVKLKWIPAQYRNFHFLTANKVEVNTFVQDKEIFFYDRYCFNGRSMINIKEHYSELFYVHPETKLLCFQPKSKKINWKEKYVAEQAKTMRIIGDYWQLVKLGGIWYEIKGIPLDKHCNPDKPMLREFDPQKRVDATELIYSYGYIKIIYKKQLNSKQLKKYNLTNDFIYSTVKCKICGGINCLIQHK
jgi:hypothetical protein